MAIKNASVRDSNVSVVKSLLAFNLFVFLFFKQVDKLTIPLSFVWFFFLFFMTKNEKNIKAMNALFFVCLYSIAIAFVYFFGGTQSLIVLFNDVTVYLIIYCSIASSMYLSRKNQGDYIIKLIILIGLINSLANIYSWVTITGGAVGRYNFASIINGSVSGNIEISVIAALLILSFSFNKKTEKWVLFAICSSNVLIILTRRIQVIYIIYIIFYVFCINHKEKRLSKTVNRLLVLIIIAILLFVTFQSVFETIFSQFYNLFDSNRADQIQRTLATRDAIEMFNSSHWLGVGYGNYALNTKYTDLASPHGGFFSILSEQGIIGMVFTLLFLFNLVKLSMWSAFEYNSNTVIAAAIITGVSALMFFTSNFTFLPPPNERAYYLGCCIGWLLIGYLIHNRDESLGK